jgi:hypothetical protein
MSSSVEQQRNKVSKVNMPRLGFFVSWLSILNATNPVIACLMLAPRSFCSPQAGFFRYTGDDFYGSRL